MKLLTKDFSIFLANYFLSSSEDDNFYLFAAKTLPYQNGDIVTPIENSTSSLDYKLYEDMIFGKYLNPSNFSIMIRSLFWEANKSYVRYDDKELDLAAKDFYAITLEGDIYSVFKCLDNNKKSPSLVPPLRSQTNPTDEFYSTSDGYIWKLIYEINETQFSKFGTDKYFPIIENQTVANNAISGSIDNIIVEDPGAGYTTYISGNVTQINVSGNSRKLYIQSDTANLATANDFYTKSAFYISSGPGQGQLREIVEYGTEGNNKYVIVNSLFSPSVTSASTFEISPNVIISQSDGTGFQGRVIIDPIINSVDKIEIVNRGEGYTQATATISANNAVFDSTHTPAVLRPVISPIGGHGSNAQKELFGTRIGISEDFDAAEIDIVDNDFRTLGILKNPVFKEAIFELDEIGGISVGATVTQAATGATGSILEIDNLAAEIIIQNVTGVFDTSNLTIGSGTYSIVNIIKNTNIFDQRTQLGVSMTFLSSFARDEIIIQQNTGASAVVHEFKDNTLYLTNVTGNFVISGVSLIIGQTTGARAVINSIIEPDILKGTGDILFVENIPAVMRRNGEVERLKITIGF